MLRGATGRFAEVVGDIEILQTVRYVITVSYTYLRAHETPEHFVCRLPLEKKNHSTSIFKSIPTLLSDAFFLHI